jgi:mannose-6-phosphate isomerase-like protein (cupin superfamily)
MDEQPAHPDAGSPNGVPHVVPAAPILAKSEQSSRMKSRWIFPPQEDGWQEFVLSEWSLEGASWTDFHPHSETNVVLVGELHVESGGATVVVSAGDTVTVPAGSTGRYWAPEFARMLAIYGPNPDAAETSIIGYAEL